MMMSHAPIMIFDESISALDPHLRRLCMDSIRKMRQGKTTIFITHDYSCLESTDTIYYMKDGSISLYGTHSHLSSRLGSSYNTILNENTFLNGQRYGVMIYLFNFSLN
jgi:ABC-type bacteriocin/lantibiotic exporter with double-glycine peptidase domain